MAKWHKDISAKTDFLGSKGTVLIRCSGILCVTHSTDGWKIKSKLRDYFLKVLHLIWLSLNYFILLIWVQQIFCPSLVITAYLFYFILVFWGSIPKLRYTIRYYHFVVISLMIKYQSYPYQSFQIFLWLSGIFYYWYFSLNLPLSCILSNDLEMKCLTILVLHLIFSLTQF